MKPYRVYDLFTNELLDDCDSYTEAQIRHRGKPVTIIYRPSKRKKK